MPEPQESTRGNQLRCHLPDTIIGIGNAGKQVVYRYLTRDWILEEAFAAREDDKNPEGFDTYVVDTATDEQKDDERMVARLNERIERLAEDSGRQPEIVKGDVSYINPLDYATDDLISRAGLTSEATVKRVAQQAGLKAWWLENEDSMLTDNYSEGVLRRRGLSKALFHASQTGGGALESLPREVGNSTSIIVGIGGGTGSGVFIDLAKQIKDEGGTVNLFAIIPGLGEKDRRRANAFGALSELEYLALRERNPFQNIILIPFGPARNLQDRDTFLDGVVQTIVARENTTNDFIEFLDESAPNGPRLYAPFTIAIPQILRYDVGDIQQTADAIQAYREAKRSALDSELNLYENLQNFLVDEWDDEAGRAIKTARDGQQINNDQFTLSGDEASTLYNRLEDLNTWIQDEEQFGHVDNTALEKWRRQLDQWISGIEEAAAEGPDKEFKKLLVTRLPDRVKSLESLEDAYPGEEGVQELDRVFRDELRAIQIRANIHRGLKLIDEDEVTEAINSAIDPDRDAWVGAQRLEDRVGSMRSDIEQYESNLDILDELETDLRSALENHKEQWRKAVHEDVADLVSLDHHQSTLTEQLEELEQSLADAFRIINNAHDPDSIPQNLIDFDFDRLNENMDEVGLEPVDAESIQLTVERTVDAYRAWYKINTTGLIGSFLGRDDETKTNYRKFLDEIDDDYVLIQPTGERDDFDRDFNCEFVADSKFSSLVDELERRRDRLLDDVVRRFDEALNSFDPADDIADYRAAWIGDDFDMTWPGDVSEYPDRLTNRLGDELDARTATEVLDRLDAGQSGFDEHGIVHVAFESAFLDPVHTRRERLEATKESAVVEADRYDELRHIVTEDGDKFDNTGPTRPQMEDLPTMGHEDSPYVRKTKSVDQLGLRQYEDIAESGIWQDRQSTEYNKILTHFKQFAQNVGKNGDVVGLFERRIEVATGDGTNQYSDVTNPVYPGHYVGNVYMGRPFKNDNNPSSPVFDGVRETLEDSGLFFREGANGYSHESRGFGAPWDLSMTTFIGGVFLDNLRPVQQVNKGYKHSYESQRDELRDNVRIRHVHAVDGLDRDICTIGQGAYVYRDSLFDINDPDDRYTILDATETELVETILEDHVGWESFASTIDLS